MDLPQDQPEEKAEVKSPESEGIDEQETSVSESIKKFESKDDNQEMEQENTLTSGTNEGEGKEKQNEDSSRMDFRQDDTTKYDDTEGPPLEGVDKSNTSVPKSREGCESRDKDQQMEQENTVKRGTSVIEEQDEQNEDFSREDYTQDDISKNDDTEVPPLEGMDSSAHSVLELRKKFENKEEDYQMRQDDNKTSVTNVDSGQNDHIKDLSRNNTSEDTIKQNGNMKDTPPKELDASEKMEVAKEDTSPSTTERDLEIALNIGVPINTSQLDTDDQVPYEVIKIRVFEDENSVILKWDELRDVENHVINLKREYEQRDFNSQDSIYKFKNSTFAFKTGEILKLKIEAFDKMNKIIAKSKKMEYIVGGDGVPTNVRAVANGKSSHNKIDIAWTAPKRTTKEYDVILYKKDKKIDQKNVSDTNASFSGLQPLNEYYCSVRSLQSDHDSCTKSNVVVTTNKPGESSKPVNVTAITDPENPYRQLIVKWQKPAGIEVKDYLCALYLDKQQKHPAGKDSERFGTGLGARFRYLKPGTTYYVTVTSIKKNGKSSDAVLATVNTEKATRTKTFDIKEAGKVKIVKNQSIIKKDGIWSDVSWKLADLGVQKYHYDLVEVSATYHNRGESEMTLDVQEQTKAQSVKLECGKTYHFKVRCTYVQLDGGGNITAKTEFIINTDIGEINNLSVNWRNDDISIKWEPAIGAASYKITILDLEGNELHVENKIRINKAKIRMDYAYTYGRNCKFRVDAFGHVASKTTFATKTVLIGGNKAVSNVLLYKSPENPRRKMYVTWKPPINKPKGYDVTLWELKSNKGEESGINARTKSVSDVVNVDFDTKTNTVYMCKVRPIYEDGTTGGSLSNSEKTEKRKDQPVEKSEKFGKPEGVNIITKHSDDGKKYAEISWRCIILSENFSHRITKISLIRKAQIFSWPPVPSATIKSFELTNNEKRIETPPLEKGRNYEVIFKIKYQDMDNEKEDEKTYTHKISIEPNATEVYTCTWENGTITFTWKTVGGASKYKLIVKDECLENTIAEESVEAESNQQQSQPSGTCHAKILMSDSLGIGMVCKSKVISFTDDNLTSESGWTSHLIGGKSVPRNVKVRKCKLKPLHSLKITFDVPRRGDADEYEVVARPHIGKMKVKRFTSTDITFEGLKKATAYTFFVNARYGNSWNDELSVSNTESTDGDGSNQPLVSVDKSTKHTYLNNGVFASKTINVYSEKGKEFGKVRELTPYIKDDEGKDILVMKWKIPTFGNNSDEYEIQYFKIKIKMGTTEECKENDIDFKKDLFEYRSKDYDLCLGETYQVSVSTVYEAIENDDTCQSDAFETTVHARPCVPSVIRNHWENDSLKIEWNFAKGAVYYNIRVFAQSSKQPLFEEVVRKKLKWIRKFDRTFGYGITYYAVITAYGKDERYNSTNTELKIIGGEYVPKNVSATIKKGVIEPSTQAFLEWDAPTKEPMSYDVASHPQLKLNKKFDKETCLLTGLKAGTEYLFQVFAIHDDEKKIGCYSNKITTDPRPTQVKNVKCSPGLDPSTSITITWDNTQEKNEDISTKYLICIKNDENREEEDKREIVVLNDALSRLKKQIADSNRLSFMAEGLNPGTQYFTTISGGNDSGYGIASLPVDIITAYGIPTDVTLTPDIKIPWKKLILNFTPSVGHPTRHSAILHEHDGESLRVIGRNHQSVNPGYVFENLESSKTYSVKLNGVFGSKIGEPCESNKTMTAPSKVIIKKYQPVQDNERSSREIFFEWNIEHGAIFYEIKIMRAGETTETVLMVKGINEMTYFCQYESIAYFVKIRSGNTLANFGDWSNTAEIELAPAKVQAIKAQLLDNGKIRVICRGSMIQAVSYFIQPECQCVPIGPKIKGSEQNKFDVSTNEQNDIVFIFDPPETAQKYTFWAWAVNTKGLESKKVQSNDVVSKPIPIVIKFITKDEQDPTRGIKVMWYPQERCDSYEVFYGILENDKLDEPECICMFATEKCALRCKNAGESYGIKVRAIRENTKGDWSELSRWHLDPTSVKLLEDNNMCCDPCESITIKWDPVAVKPDEYIATLYCGNKIIDRYNGDSTGHTFNKNLKPGSKCFCEVRAKKMKRKGKAVTTKTYTIEWPLAELQILLDTRDSSKKIIMKWNEPFGVNCFKLEIENKKTGALHARKLFSQSYIMESALPGNTYAVRLYCGCDDRYSQRFVEKTITTEPEPVSKIRAAAILRFNGLMVDFHDHNAMTTSYHIWAHPLCHADKKKFSRSSQCHVIMKDLEAGESYKISVISKIDEISSKEVLMDDYVQTFPAEIERLTSEYDNGSIIFRWDSLPIPPDKYEIQWKVDNKQIINDSTGKCQFVIFYAQPAHVYSVRVSASNSSGCGKKSRWETFVTDPPPPYNIKVSPSMKNPETSFIVRFEDKRNAMKTYKITAKPLGDGDDIATVTDDLSALITGLKSGHKYNFYVQTIFCGKYSVEVPYNEEL